MKGTTGGWFGRIAWCLIRSDQVGHEPFLPRPVHRCRVVTGRPRGVCYMRKGSRDYRSKRDVTSASHVYFFSLRSARLFTCDFSFMFVALLSVT
jgi:hypothetical protein